MQWPAKYINSEKINFKGTVTMHVQQSYANPRALNGVNSYSRHSHLQMLKAIATVVLSTD